MADFKLAIKGLLKHEGGYSHDPDDQGGKTKFGISKRSYPGEDIAALTKTDAIAIYERDWWVKYGYEKINSQLVADKVFDLSVNVGAKWAHRICQRALLAEGHKVVEDGMLGPVSFRAINRADSLALLAAIRSEAAGYYRMIAARRPTQRKYLRGWLNRAYS